MAHKIVPIELLQASTDSLAADGSQSLGQLYTLLTTHQTQYDKYGAVKDLDQKIDVIYGILKQTPHTNENFPRLLQLLAVAYLERSCRQDKQEFHLSMKYIDEAIRVTRKAMDLIQKDHISYAYFLRTLGQCYRERHRLKEAVAFSIIYPSPDQRDHVFDAIRNHAPVHFNAHETLQTNNGIIVSSSASDSDIEKAIQALQEAADRLPVDSKLRKRAFHDLGRAHDDKFEVTGEIADLEDSIRIHLDAFDETDDNDPDSAQLMWYVASAYEEKFELVGDNIDFTKMMEFYHESLNHNLSGPSWRLRSGIKILNILASGGFWSRAYEIACTTSTFIPLLVHHSQDHAYKNHLLSASRGLSSDATTTALMMEKPAFEIIRLNELGRGIIIGSVLQRSMLKRLQISHPAEFSAIEDLQAQFHTAPRVLDQARNMGDIERLLDEKAQEIRRLPGFGDFLSPPSEDDILSAAIHGPIVLLLPNPERCDAVLIKETGLVTLPLPGLKYEDVPNTGAAMFDPVVLEWLWDTIAKPVLEALGFTETPAGADWPHIWWIPTNALVGLPIHAAGYHHQGSTNTVIDRVISSYSSSVKSLIQARKNNKTESETDQTLNTAEHGEVAVLVGTRNLPLAPQEVNQLEGICQSMELQTMSPLQNREAVLSALENCRIFHFAGHGRANSLDPLQSCLVLDAGTLTVDQLFDSNINQQKPFLAYLSACGTGQISDRSSTDESIHLMSAFELVGFQNVVGTLWNVEDGVCPSVAIDTYTWIMDKQFARGSVAEGLHHALRSLRDRWLWDKEESSRGKASADNSVKVVSEPCIREISRDIELCDQKQQLYWIPYIHYGL
jgi:tetratricopeptide (TPR) repeat protein